MLTDTQVRRVKPSEPPQKLADARGLYLLVTSGGGRYWCYDYSFNGKRRTLAFGVYPKVSLGWAVTLLRNKGKENVEAHR